MHLNSYLLISILVTTSFLSNSLFAQEEVFDFERNTKIIQSNGEDFPVVDYGSGPVVLLLHGFPDTKELWRNQIPVLAAAGYRVIAPDLRGYAGAPRSLEKEKYSIPALMEDVIGIMDGLKIEKAHLVGHDWGAGLGWTLANYYEHRFLSYTTMSVGAAGTTAWNSFEQRRSAWYFYFFMQEGLAETALKNNEWAMLKEFCKSHPDLDTIVERLSEPTAMTTALNWYRGNFGHLLAPCEGEYEGDGTYFAMADKKVTIPVLGIWSENDKYLLEPQMVQSNEAVETSFTYRKVKNAGHWMMLDQPKVVNELLLDFLKLN